MPPTERSFLAMWQRSLQGFSAPFALRVLNKYGLGGWGLSIGAASFQRSRNPSIRHRYTKCQCGTRTIITISVGVSGRPRIGLGPQETELQVAQASSGKAGRKVLMSAHQVGHMNRAQVSGC